MSLEIHADLQALIDVTRQAGDRALAMQADIESHVKADGTPVSAGDQAANDIIVAGLKKIYPEDAILSEEMHDDLSRLKQRRLWIIDPIDGTSSYIHQRQEWAVQIALAEDGELRLGLLYFPSARRLYIGKPGLGAWCIEDQEQPYACSIESDQPLILLCSRSKRNATAMEQAKAILSEFSCTSISSVGAKVDLMIQGRGSVYVNPSPIHEWDYAAPAAVLMAAGGNVSGFDHKALPINSETATCSGLIFSAGIEHRAIVDRLQDMDR